MGLKRSQVHKISIPDYILYTLDASNSCLQDIFDDLEAINGFIIADEIH